MLYLVVYPHDDDCLNMYFIWVFMRSSWVDSSFLASVAFFCRSASVLQLKGFDLGQKSNDFDTDLCFSLSISPSCSFPPSTAVTLSAETTGTHPTMNQVQINIERKKKGARHAKAFRSACPSTGEDEQRRHMEEHFGKAFKAV